MAIVSLAVVWCFLAFFPTDSQAKKNVLLEAYEKDKRVTDAAKFDQFVAHLVKSGIIENAGKFERTSAGRDPVLALSEHLTQSSNEGQRNVLVASSIYEAWRTVKISRTKLFLLAFAKRRQEELANRFKLAFTKWALKTKVARHLASAATAKAKLKSRESQLAKASMNLSAQYNSFDEEMGLAVEKSDSDELLSLYDRLIKSQKYSEKVQQELDYRQRLQQLQISAANSLARSKSIKTDFKSTRVVPYNEQVHFDNRQLELVGQNFRRSFVNQKSKQESPTRLFKNAGPLKGGYEMSSRKTVQNKSKTPNQDNNHRV